MKKIITLSSILIVTLAVFQSCTKEPLVVSKEITISLKENEAYQLDLGKLGKDQVAEITRQAAHFQTSQTQTLTSSLNTTYIYVPSINYNGTDEVEITVSNAAYESGTQCGFGGGNQNNGSHSGNGWGSCGQNGQDDKTVYTVLFTIGKNPG